MSYFPEIKTKFDQDQASVDAAGRVRSSTITTLGEYKGTHDHLYLFSTVASNGAVAYNSTAQSYRLTLSGSASGDYAVLQTKAMHNYFNGKSHLIEFTMDQFDDEVNVQKTVGYYSSTTSAPYAANKDGIWVTNDAGTMKMEVYKDGVQKFSQSIESWVNENGIAIDNTKFLVFGMDFLYLGGTRVRLFIKIKGVWYLVTAYDHANEVEGTMVRHPTQPIRAEIRSVGAYTGTPTLDFHCASVQTEGSLNMITETRPIHMGASFVNANTAGTWYALKGLRIKATDRHSVTVAAQVSVQAVTADNFLWGLFINPTVAGTFTYSDVADSHIQEATGDTSGNPSATTVTSGRLVEAKLGNSSETVNVMLDDIVDKIGSHIDGTMDELVLAVMPMTANLDVRGVIVPKTYT